MLLKESCGRLKNIILPSNKSVKSITINPTTYTDDSPNSSDENEPHPENIELSDNEEAHKPIEFKSYKKNSAKSLIKRNKNAQCKDIICFSTVYKKSIQNIRMKEGWLKKRSKSLFEDWKIKYCKLENSLFMFYKDKELKLLSGCIDFNRVLFNINIDKTALCFL